MPFQPAALDERTLKAFVDRLIKSSRNTSAVALKRAVAQETVAHMLGFPNWHAASTAVSEERAPTYHKPESSTAIGLYPSEPPRFTPDHACALLLWAFSVGASDVMVREGEKVLVDAYGRRFRVTEHVLSAEEEKAFSVAGKNPFFLDSNQSNPYPLHTFQEWATTFQRPSGAFFRARVCREVVSNGDKSWMETSFRLIASTPPDLSVLLENEPALKSQLTAPTQGLVLVTGGFGQGKTTLLSSLLKEQMALPDKRIVSHERPVEYDYAHIDAALNTTLTQNDVVNIEGGMPKAISASLRIPFLTTIGVGEMRDWETIQETLKAAATGHLVYANQHSENVPDSLTRPLRACPQQRWKDYAVDLIGTTKVVVSQRLVSTTRGTRVALREWLVITPEIERKFLVLLEQARDPVHFRGLLEDLVDRHGHTYEAHAQRLFESGVISKKTRDDYAKWQAARRQEKHH